MSLALSDGELLAAGPAPAACARLRVAMVSSLAERCGVADYTRYLVAELDQRLEIAWLTDPDGFAPAMNEADIVHVQHQYFLFGGVAPWKSTFRRFADRVTAPLVMTVHEFVAPQGSPPRRLAVAASNRLHFLHPAIRAYIVHTNVDRQKLIEAGVPAQRVHVVRHGVPPAPMLPNRVSARAALGFSQHFVMTIFGFLSQRKGHSLAVDALAHLPGNVRLVLAGGKHPDDRTRYVEELREHIVQAGAEDRVIITGYLSPEDAAATMSATDLVLAPFIEGSGSGSLAYAFACGRPVLAV
ncbi:MAG: glycosyltransferase, partial [Armatimonadetes bacterium]|nr:glycosyltransferase [Armatimonadota bacterium]